jgi:hypothetical protein
MANKAEYVQLETGDDVASVRDRLSFLRGQRVLLIWPEEGTVLTRKLDLVLVQREAMRRAIRLALVTHDPIVTQHAAELNISTFETIGASERGRWKRGRSKVFANRFQRPKDEPLPEDLKEVASRIYAEESALERRGRIIRGIIAAILFLAAAGGLGAVLIPSATIILAPAQSRIATSAEIIADPQSLGIDIENRIIPATILSVQIEETGTISTTGVQDLQDTTAAGSVIFINQANQPVTIPQGTIVTTGTGDPVQFRTTQQVELPGGVGLQIEVPIEALQGFSGETGNVASGTINTIIGPLAENVTVRNLAPTAGGANRIQKVISQADRDNLLAIVKQQIQTRAYSEMQANVTATQCIILDSIRIGQERDDWKIFSGDVGQAADSLSLTMRAVIDATVIEVPLARQVILAQLSGQVQPGQILNPQTIAYDSGCESVVGFDQQTGRATFTLSGTGVITSVIDTGVVAQNLAGRLLTDAAAYLVTELPLQQGIVPQITVQPDGLDRMPLLPFRILIQIQEVPLV